MDKEKWMIISWNKKQDGFLYGYLLDSISGTEDRAREIAMQYIPKYSPVGIVREIFASND